MQDQDIAEAKERVNALRDQITSAKSEAAVLAFETSKNVRLKALTDEERHLEQQLEEIRATVAAGAPDAPAAVELQSIPVEEVVEGESYVETVDAQGNLVRMRAEDVGTMETDAPPPDVPDDATMTSREPRS